MRTREATIHAEESYAAAGTAIYPIREKDPISRILIPFGVTVGANARLQHISKCISKIEIVDGSDVLFSMSGDQLDGISRLDRGGSTAMFTGNTRSTTDYGNLAIDFGRHLYDKEIAFEPSKFRNPQILVTHNAALAVTGGVRVDYGILADIMEGGGGSVRGFLMKKELESWLAAAAAWHYVNMPKDFPYRAVWIQGKTNLIGVDGHWSRALLQEDNYARVPFDCLVNDQIADNAADYGLIVEPVSGTVSAVATPEFCAPCYAGNMIVNNQINANGMYTSWLNGGQYNVVSANGTDDFRGHAEGLCPHGLVVFNMGPKDNIEDWYDPTALGNLKLEVLGAGARTIRVVTEQLRPNVPR